MFRACRLDDIVYAATDKTSFEKEEILPYIGLEHLRQRGAGLIGSSPATESISVNTIFKAGDVLFGKLRPNLRKSALAPFDGYCSTDILVLRPKDGISSRFAAKVFQSERVGAAAERTAAGTNMPRTSWSALRALEVYCPAIESQESLADVLDTLDTTIRQTESIIEKLKLVKQGLLHDLLTRGIDANGELRPPQSQAPHLYKDSPLGWMPNDWDAFQFSELAEYTNGNTFDAGHWSRHGLPIIRIQNLNGSNSFNYYEGPINSRWRVHPGDLLFAWSGQRGVSFGPRLWSGPEGVLNQHIFKVTAKNDVISKDFLFEILRFRQSVIEDSAHGFKDSFLHVTRGELGAVFAGVPPADEQSMITIRIAAFEAKLMVERATLAKDMALKSALMDDLLTGRVRVTPLLNSPGV